MRKIWTRGHFVCVEAERQGGALSIIAVILSFVGVVAAVIKAIMWIF